MTGRAPLHSIDAAFSDGRERPHKSTESRAEIVALHQLARDCIIVIGRTDGEMIADGVAAIATRGGDRGRFRAISWSSSDPGDERWYLAAVRMPEVGDARPGECLLLHGTGATAPIMTPLPSRHDDSASFALELRARAGDKLDLAATFLLDTFPSRASRQMPGISAFLAAILDCTCQEDGVVEIMGAIDGDGLLLQGWLRRPFAGRQRLLLMGDILDDHEAICANFPRADLDGAGLGMLALVRPKGGVFADVPQKVYFRAGNLFHRMSVLPNAVRLRDEDAPNHLRDMLPTLLVDEGLKRTFHNAARPRFTGVDTVSTSDQPIRMAVDLAACIPDVGWYVTGWMLDPANLAAKVVLRGGDGLNERLDDRWTRVPREDVNAGFRTDPLFQGLINHDRHGFTVFVPNRATLGQAWIELQLAGERYAFIPVNSVAIETWAGRQQLLESFDIHKPSAREIVECHLGPLFHGAKSSQKRIAPHRVLRARLASMPALEAALIIPVTEPGLRTKLVVSELASRDPGTGVIPTFVCSSAIGEGANVLLREIAFYGLDAQVLLTDNPVDSCEAIEIGARATTAPNLVFMSPTTHPLQTHWATQLLALVDNNGEASVASPTLLYEDWSICYGGVDGVRFLDTSPFADAASSRAGYPRDAMPDVGVTPTLAASLDCCAMARSAFEQVEGFSAGYTLARANGLDLFLRMRKAGMRMVWAPQVEVYTLGDSGGQSEYWTRTGEMIDGWSLRASWKDRLPPVIDLTNAISPRAGAAEPDLHNEMDGKQEIVDTGDFKTVRRGGMR